MPQLAKCAVAKIAAFERETGEPIASYQSAALKIAHHPEHLEQLRREVERGRSHGNWD
jgi:hypothetical protein